MKARVVLVGGGGHCKACIEIIESAAFFDITGILDVKERVGGAVLGHPIVGTDEDVEGLLNGAVDFLISVGHVRSAEKRRELFDRLSGRGARFAVVVSPTATVAKSAAIGRGTIVMHRAIVNAAATVGMNCIINTGAIVEHDARVGSHCHVSTSAVVNGNCCIGDGVMVGSNSTLLQGVTITGGVVIGAGSVVVKDIDEPGVYIGCPAKKTETPVENAGRG
jgi:sugar O-acyltransferase (sialic acid O-acetyltransferase NeuD family)